MADLPNLSQASILRFLGTCPMFRDLSSAELDTFAARLQPRHHTDGTRLFDDARPGPEQPLRVIVHGRASWTPAGTSEKPGAWLLMPGAVFGLDSVMEWARRSDHPDTWQPLDPPQVSCRANGSLWTLELAPERFSEVFEAAESAALCARLLRQYPTLVNAPDIVAQLRQLDDFNRVATSTLYRLLDRAPTYRFSKDDLLDKLELQHMQQEQLGPQLLGPQLLGPAQLEPMFERSRGRALYFVIEGQLMVPTEVGTMRLTPGELGGPNPFARTQEFMDAAWTESSCRAVVLYSEALQEMMRAEPGFARSLGPHVHAGESQHEAVKK